MRVLRIAAALVALAGLLALVGCGDPAFTSGKVYIGQGNYEMAIQELTMAVENSPGAWEPRMWLGRAYAESEALEEAHDAFFEALELAPDQKAADEVEDVITYYWLIYDRQGEQYIEGAKFEDARVEFEKAIVIDPRKVDAYINLGYAYHMSMDYDKAIEVFEQAREYEPENEVLNENLLSVYETKGGSMASISDYAGAVRYFEKIRSIDPEYPDIVYNIGLMYYQMKDYREALSYFRQHLDADPEDEEVLYRVFLAYWALGQDLAKEGQEEMAAEEYAASLPYLQRLIDLNDQEITYHRALARIYNKLGRNEEALHELSIIEQLMGGESTE